MRLVEDAGADGEEPLDVPADDRVADAPLVATAPVLVRITSVSSGPACGGTIIVSAALIALSVSNPRDGGQSMMQTS